MNIKQQVEINADVEAVWQNISDIKNCDQMIPAIIKVEVLNDPTDGLIGFKWKETRKIFGKEADETMWIIEAMDNHYYKTQAENSGALYESTMMVEKIGNKTVLSMEFSGKALTFMAKILSFIFTPLMKGSMSKMIKKDLEDIRDFIEK